MNQVPEDLFEVFLQPGEIYFGDRNTRIRTILGSCVSITLWHPRRLIGGMCHFMLPKRPRHARAALDGRYADEAMALLLRETRRHRTRPGDYQAKMFGGGAMFSERPGGRRVCDEIGQQNVRTAQKLMDAYGFPVVAQHLGGVGHRNIIFDLWSGNVWMKHISDILEPGTHRALAA